MINLDFASHTPPDEAILAEFCRAEREFAGNAFAAHGLGGAARAEIKRAATGIAALIGIAPEEIIFTSGASEANNFAVKGIARAYAHSGKHILSTCLEHPSVGGALEFLREAGFEIELLKILPNGKIDLEFLERALRRDTILLCVSAVDSELGAVQPLEEIAEIAARFENCHMHIDAAQAAGKIPLALPQNFSTLCFSPHKFHGLCGFGVLVKCAGIVLEPLIHGGNSAALYRAGTPSPAMAAACFLALKNALDSLEKNSQAVRALREYLRENLPPDVKINSPPDASPYILNISSPTLRGAEFQAALNERGIAVSVKSACSADNAPSRPVFATTGNKKNALNSWRVSFGKTTTKEEIDAFLNAFHEIQRAGRASGTVEMQ